MIIIIVPYNEVYTQRKERFVIKGYIHNTKKIFINEVSDHRQWIVLLRKETNKTIPILIIIIIIWQGSFVRPFFSLVLPEFLPGERRSRLKVIMYSKISILYNSFFAMLLYILYRIASLWYLRHDWRHP